MHSGQIAHHFARHLQCRAARKFIMIRNPSVQGALLGLSSFGLFALADVTIKFMGLGLSPVQIIFTAGLFSLPLIVLRAISAEGNLSLRPKLPLWSIIRVALILVNSIFVSYTFTKLPLAQAYAIFFCMPLLITVLAVPLLGERLDLPRILAILLGFSGVLVALRPGHSVLQLAHLTAILGATLGALNSLILRNTGKRERPSIMLLYPAMAQVIVLGAIMPWFWQPMDPFTWSLAALLGFLSVAGGILIISAYSSAHAIVVAPMQYSQIIWGALCGAFIFGEKMDALMVLGIGVIVAAGLFLLWTSGQSMAGSTKAQ